MGLLLLAEDRSLAFWSTFAVASGSPVMSYRLNFYRVDYSFIPTTVLYAA